MAFPNKQMSCQTLSTSECSPNRCYDWDTCNCGDCPDCGGPALQPEPQNSQTDHPTSSVSNETAWTPSVASKASTAISSKPVSLYYMPFDEYISMIKKENLVKEKIEAEKRKKEYDEKIKIKRVSDNSIMRSSKATIERNKVILKSTQDTLDKLRNSIEGCL